MPSPKPREHAADVPKVGTLRALLSFDDSTSSRTKNFNDTLRAFRRTYKTSNGVVGVEFHDWKNREHHKHLSHMTDTFLEDRGYGKIFWPDGANDVDKQPLLTYSKDRQNIKRTLKELIFRLNQQEFRNNKYKKKDRNVPAGLNHRGRSSTDPIDLDDGESTVHDHQMTPVSPAGSRHSTLNPETQNEKKVHPPSPGVAKLKFKVPETLTRALSSASTAEGRAQASLPRGSTATKRSSASKPDEPGSTTQSNKKQRIDATVDARSEPGFGNHPSKLPPSTEVTPEKRSSTRKKTKFTNPGYVSWKSNPLDDVDDDPPDDMDDDDLDQPQSPLSTAGGSKPRNRQFTSTATSKTKPQKLPNFTRFEELEKDPQDQLSFPNPVAGASDPKSKQFTAISNSTSLSKTRAPKQLDATSLQELEEAHRGRLRPLPTTEVNLPSIQFPSVSTSDTNSSLANSKSDETPGTGNGLIETTNPENISVGLAHLPKPADLPPAALDRPEIEQSTPQVTAPIRASPSQTPRLELIYSVIKSHEPVFEYEIWRPEGGRFLEMTLAQIATEIPKTRPIEDMASLIFVLELPSMPVKCKIACFDEPGFRVLKMQFNRHITRRLSETTERPLVLEMTIEPVYKLEETKEDVLQPLEDVLDW